VLNNVDSATNLLLLLDSFTRASGLKLNINKSKGLWIGSNRNNIEKPLNVDWPKEPIKALGVYFSYDNNAVDNMNFTTKLKQIKFILNIWKCRRLTLSGKILLIKTFALSKFIYLSSVIHIPDHIVQQIDKIIHDFLWNGGKGFVKRRALIGDYDEGGLKMVDVKSIFKAHKIKWANRYNTTSATWKIILNEYIFPYGGEIVFHCNIHSKHINSWNNIPIFYKDMFKSYFDFINPDNVAYHQQCVWNNHHIRINHKSLYYKHFSIFGINLVSDLFYTNGNIIPFETWNQRGINNKYFMQWRVIIDAIPSTWKQTLRHGFVRKSCVTKGYILTHGDNEMNIIDMTSKIIYRKLVQRITESPTSQKRYKKELNVNDNEWSDIYLTPFKSSYDVRTRIFQYKINVNCLMTNSRLFKMNIVDSVNCSFCNMYPETLKHLFWDCIHAVEIWDDFKFWFDIKTNTSIDLDYKKILFSNGMDTLLNLCLILVKKVIYDSRFKDQISSIITFKYLIKCHYKLEKQIAIHNHTMYTFANKWNALENCVMTDM
jgi:hypothetical protein